jgi:XTP/dITP diphosphohydrolase
LEILVASRNKGKVREIRKALRGLGVRIYSLDDFAGVSEIEEDGKSFAENALKKARFYSKQFGKLTLSDDSGLEVDRLKGMPGIYSARYAGGRATSREKNEKLLKEMEGFPLSKRGARFKCAIAIATPDGREAVVEGSCRGKIGFRLMGKNGFGYDPLFVLPQYGKTMAQLSLEEKNRISHRGKALRRLRNRIKTLISKHEIRNKHKFSKFE